MRYISGTQNFELERSSVVTLGKFDGIHRGHQKLINIVNQKAKENNLLSVAFTFDRIPLTLLPQSKQHFISTNLERKRFLTEEGIDVEVEYPFTNELMHMEPDDFIKEILINKLHAKIVVVGTDYCFGRNRAGDAQYLKKHAESFGFEAIVVEKEKFQDREISSTYVREELRVGHMETVNMLLGRPFSIYGTVSPGAQVGHKIDTPTINIYPQASKLLPPNGVYATVTVIDDKEYKGVTNVGVKPTVSDAAEVDVETHLFEFDEDIYGRQVEVRLLHFIRPEMKFESLDSLKAQVDKDQEFAKEMFM